MVRHFQLFQTQIHQNFCSVASDKHSEHEYFVMFELGLGQSSKETCVRLTSLELS